MSSRCGCPRIETLPWRFETLPWDVEAEVFRMGRRGGKTALLAATVEDELENRPYREAVEALVEAMPRG